MDECVDLSGIREYLENEFGIKLPKGRMFLNERKVFLYTGRELGFEGRYGMYLGSLDGPFRPSTYAAQLATKGIVDVDEKQANTWMCGLDIKVQAQGYYAVVRYKGYLLGVGKPKEGRIINNLPKNRRLPLSCLK